MLELVRFLVWTSTLGVTGLPFLCYTLVKDLPVLSVWAVCYNECHIHDYEYGS